MPFTKANAKKFGRMGARAAKRKTPKRKAPKRNTFDRDFDRGFADSFSGRAKKTGSKGYLGGVQFERESR